MLQDLKSIQLNTRSSFVFGLGSEASTLLEAPTLLPASLIVIDRTEDLFTPSTQSMSNEPLAQRILNALQLPSVKSTGQAKDGSAEQTTAETEDFIDIPLRSWAATVLEDTLCDQTTTSSALLPSANASALRRVFMAHPEDEYRQALCAELSHAVQREHGVLPPPKQRGLGAEVLALIQSLLIAPGVEVDDRETTGKRYNDVVACRHHNLIAHALTVIETMQRSSAKQFYATCQWKCALDTLRARDTDLFCSKSRVGSPDSFLSDNPDFDALISKILKSFSLYKKTAKEESTNGSSLISISPKKQSSAKKDDGKDGPVDIIHVILQTIGCVE
jgi:hypothetical protein